MAAAAPAPTATLREFTAWAAITHAGFAVFVSLAVVSGRLTLGPGSLRSLVHADGIQALAQPAGQHFADVAERRAARVFCLLGG
jgi:hypothetical protein